MNNYDIERVNYVTCSCILLTLTGVYTQCNVKVDTLAESIQDGRRLRYIHTR